MALAPRHQTLHVGSAKTEMPEERVLEDLLPGTDTRRRGASIRTSFRHPARIFRRGRHRAVTMLPISCATTSTLPIFSSSRTAVISPPCVFLSYPAAGWSERPIPAQIGRHDRVRPDQGRRERRPHVSGLAIAVKQDDRRAVAADPHENMRAVYGDHPGLEPGRGRAPQPPRPGLRRKSSGPATNAASVLNILRPAGCGIRKTPGSPLFGTHRLRRSTRTGAAALRRFASHRNAPHSQV